MWPFSWFKKKKKKVSVLDDALQQHTKTKNHNTAASAIKLRRVGVNMPRTVKTNVGMRPHGKEYYDDGPDTVDAVLVGAMLMRDDDDDVQPRKYTDEPPVVNNYTPEPDAVKPEPIETYTSSSHDSGYSSSDNDSGSSYDSGGNDD